MHTIPFTIAAIMLIVNLSRGVDPLEAATRSMIVYIGVLVVLALHRAINSRAGRVRAGDAGRETEDVSR